MEFVRDHKDDPLTPAMVFELHRLVTEKTLDNPAAAGQFRTVDDDILVVDEASEQILHTPPPSSELPRRLERLCAFANDDNSDIFIHPVIRAILLHFMLAYDHPFVDGNGRTARALFYWSMANQGYWLIEFTSISKIINKAPAKYGYAFLYSETDDNDVTYFIIHQLDVILRALEQLHQYLARKVQEIREATALLAQTRLANQLNHRQITLLEHALKNPNTIYRIREHQSLHGVTYQTARTDFMLLADDLKLLHKMKDGRAFVYVAPIDLKERIAALR
jgi:Fic family protein